MRARIANQDGIVMPIVTSVMLVVSILVATVFTAAHSVNDTSLEDRNSKAALAAAEAGLAGRPSIGSTRSALPRFPPTSASRSWLCHRPARRQSAPATPTSSATGRSTRTG